MGVLFFEVRGRDLALANEDIECEGDVYYRGADGRKASRVARTLLAAYDNLTDVTLSTFRQNSVRKVRYFSDGSIQTYRTTVCPGYVERCLDWVRKSMEYKGRRKE